MNLDRILGRATRAHWAIPHFNVSSLEMLTAIADAGFSLRAPLMIGTSEGEREAIGMEEAVNLVRLYREECGLPMFLNADHTKSVKAAKAAVDAGYDSIHIDLSKLPFGKNVAGTRKVVRYAKRKNKEISVEGELGPLATDSSRLYNGKIKVDPKSFTKPAEAVKFVKLTGVNRLAPAVGNYHGIASNKKEIHFALIQALRRALPASVALVLHGGSGSGDDAFRAAIYAGIANIHISTELRVAWTETLKITIRKNPDEMTPYRLTAASDAAIQKKAAAFIALFGAKGKA